MSKILLHVDLNQFFVTCAIILNPSLKGKPIAVGGEGRAGIVSTCSYEARKYGIHSGMPTFQAKKLYKDLIIVSVDYNFIELMSKEFFAYIRKFVDEIEVLSCDECYCDITNSYKKFANGDILTYLKNIQYGLYKKTKLKCSIGVAPTKFLAKMGSDYKKPMGITIIRKKDVKNILFPLKVGDFYGIGKTTAPKLNKVGIYTIGDLYYAIKNKNNSKLDDVIGDFKEGIIKCLEGNSSDKLNSYVPKSKSIGTTRTLPFDTTDSFYLRKTLEEQAHTIIHNMQLEGYLVKTISITFKMADYDECFKSLSYSYSFKEVVENEEILINKILELFDKNYKGESLRLIGVSLKNLVLKQNAITQMTFDNYEWHEKDADTFMLINKINRKFNKEILKRASDIDKHGNK